MIAEKWYKLENKWYKRNIKVFKKCPIKNASVVSMNENSRHRTCCTFEIVCSFSLFDWVLSLMVLKVSEETIITLTYVTNGVHVFIKMQLTNSPVVSISAEVLSPNSAPVILATVSSSSRLIGVVFDEMLSVLLTKRSTKVRHFRGHGTERERLLPRLITFT